MSTKHLCITASLALALAPAGPLSGYDPQFTGGVTVAAADISGVLNGIKLPNTQFKYSYVRESEDPFWSVILRGELPDPADVYPGVRIDDKDWLTLNMPHIMYVAVGGQFAFPHCIYDKELDSNCRDPLTTASRPISPAGVDEAFSESLGSGETVQGHFSYFTPERRVVHSFNAELESGVSDPGANAPEVGVAVFPPHRSGLPLKPHKVKQSVSRRATGRGVLDGLALLKNRDGVQPPFQAVWLAIPNGRSFFLLVKFLPPEADAEGFAEGLRKRLAVE